MKHVIIERKGMFYPCEVVSKKGKDEFKEIYIEPYKVAKFETLDEAKKFLADYNKPDIIHEVF